MKLGQIHVTCHARRDIDTASADESIPHGVISISTPGKEYQAISTPSPTMFLVFDDLEWEPEIGTQLAWGLKHPPTLCSVNDAELVVTFVKCLLNAGTTRILVHCDAGLSRSAGVAAAISAHFNGDDGWFWEKRIPNKLVYRLVLVALKLEDA